MLLLFLFFLSLAGAYDLVLINSLDYGDIVNGVDYSIFDNSTALFVPHNYNYDILTIKIGKGNNIFYIEGNPITPLIANYTFQYNNVTLLKSNNSTATNHLLFREIKPKKVIVVNYYYPDYVVSTFPYAIHEGVFILLDIGNITELQQMMEEVSPNEIYAFGPLPSSTYNYLEERGAQFIGTLGEDRYKDSIALFQFYYNPEKYGRMAMLATGEQLEESMVTNASVPLLLVGDVVPPTIYNFIKELARNGTLKGVYIFERKIVTPVYNMKKQLEQELGIKFGLLLKYGQAVASQGGQPAPLGVFLLPIPASGLELEDIIYDKGSLIFGIVNPTTNIEYVLIEAKVYADGEQKESFLSPLIRLDGGESTTITMPLNVSNLGQNITVEYIIRYGLYKDSLDRVITGKRDIVITDYKDPSQLNITYITYKDNQLTFILENPTNLKVYAYPKLVYYEEGEQKVIKGSLLEINPGESVQQSFYLNTTNKTLLLEIDYGSRPGLLLNKLEVTYTIKEEVPWFLYLIIILLILLLLFLLFLLYKRRRKREEE